MKLCDYPPLQVDENVGKIFGPEQQLTILGFYRGSGRGKQYVVLCSLCSKDCELNGEGIFSTTLFRLKTDQMPCGCSKAPRYNEEQRLVLLDRVCKAKGLEFIKYLDIETTPDKRRVVLSCKKHGCWDTTRFGIFIKTAVSCPSCAHENNPSSKPQDIDVVMKRLEERYYKSNLRESGVFMQGILGEYRNQQSRVSFKCSEHGLYDISINQFLSKGTGCHRCASKIRPQSSQDDEKMISSFWSTGSFSEGTTFKRLDKKSKYGCHIYWQVYCSECDVQYVRQYACLQQGRKGCLCKNSKIEQAYINFVFDLEENPLAVKFGIAVDSELRLKKLNQKNNLTVINHKVFKFQNEFDCRLAETECKLALTCKILDKQLMPDGWTETTFIHNLDKVVEIYKKHGGVELER